MRPTLIGITISLLLSCAATGQQKDDFVKTDGITQPLHRSNIGRITFMQKEIPIEDYQATDFLQSFELKDGTDLHIRAFLGNSLTNYLHRLNPSLPAETLVRSGNYQFSFYVDDSMVYKENLPAGAGSPQYKNTKTILRVPLISSTNEDSWGRFLWNRFMMNGGEDALTAGPHLLKIEMRPYINTGEIRTGDLIAAGQLKVNVIKPVLSQQAIQVQPIAPNSGWELAAADYDTAAIQALNRQIGERYFKNITSIVVIKNGKLLIEEYFNGASRSTLQDTRSVGKSFASAMMGIAIKEGHIKNEQQQLANYYDLEDFAHYSTQKDSVTLQHLLTMSAAFEGSDNDPASPGNEENMYPTANWVKFALDLPMNKDRKSGAQWNYFTAGVVVLGDILNRSVPGGLEKYADLTLMQPLGITTYQWQYTPQHVANTAGGLRMRTLDFAKFGQLYKNNGAWEGRQLIPSAWVHQSFSKHLPISGRQHEYYGYLFWNKAYQVAGRSYETWYCTGNGGNKIFVFRDQPLVIVITATAYGTPYAHPQVDKMMERYILPAVIK